MILEPIMMNAGVIPPEEGYLEGVREIVHEHGALLAFDEVKCGVTTAYGGATGHLGVRPDMVCLAKAMGGGVPCGAIGGTEEVMGHIADGTYEQVGTFNGNPLTMAASRADADRDPHARGVRALRPARAGSWSTGLAGRHRGVRPRRLPALVRGQGLRSPSPASRVRNYRDFLELDDRFSQAHWLFQHNGGVFLPPWGKAEQWTLSVQHSEDDARRFVDNFESLRAGVTQVNAEEGPAGGHVQLVDLAKRFGGLRGGVRHRPGHPARRVLLAAGPERVRQDDDPAS